MNAAVESTKRARQIFLRSRELPDDQRESFLIASCEGNEKLRESVLQLADEAKESGGRLADLADRVSGQASSTQEDHVPKIIGPYRVRGLIGRGGMGAVYAAERTDGQFDQRVAIKTLPAQLASGEAKQRFLRERQILARLDHPNICHLLDGGVTDDGLPYFVMDHVDGMPIDEFANQRQLTIDERLRLFLQVCAAVEFAHQNLVLHRDIKPANVIVDGAGRVRLLDFGVARFLDDLDGGADCQTTHLPITPRYASPEQIRSGPVTTATDVYGLGMLLYRLLTDAFPHDLDGQSITERFNTLSEQEATPATRRLKHLLASVDHRLIVDRAAAQRGVDAKGLIASIAGDLEIILTCALRLEPTERYGNVSGLATDIERHLQHQPISARPTSFTYRASRFVRRHKVPVALSAVIATLLLTLTISAAWSALRIVDQNRAIVAERDRAEALSGFLIGMFQDARPQEVREGNEISARDLINAGVRKLDEGKLSLATKADLLASAGDLYGYLGEYEDSVEVLEKHLAIRQSVDGPSSSSALDAVFRLFVSEEALGRWPEAQKRAEAAVEMAEALNDVPRLAYALTLAGRMSHLQNDLESARQKYERATRLLEQTQPSETDDRVTALLGNYAVLERQLGNLERAETLHRQALSINERIYGKSHIEVASHLLGLGQVLTSQKRLDEARDVLQRGLNITLATVGDETRFGGYLHNSLGVVEKNAGRLEQAEKHYRASVEIWASISPGNPTTALSRHNLAKLLLARDRYSDAAAQFESARDALSESSPEDWRVYDIDSYWGASLIHLKQYAKAEALLTAAYTALLDQAGGTHPTTRAAATHLAGLYDATDQPALADEYRSLATRD